MVTIKTEKEINNLKEGGKRLAQILHKLSKIVAPGTSTYEFEELTQNLLKESGDKASFLGFTPSGAKRAYPASVCISINDEIVHGIPNENPRNLKTGDIVSIDMGLIHEGLFVDGAITVGVGIISPEARRLLKANKEALDAGIKAARGGAHIGDIGFAIEKVAKAYGYNLAEDLCGHGVGYAVHEDPFVPNWGKKGEGLKLRPGMVLAIEPMLILESTKSGKSKIKISPDGYTYSSSSRALSSHFEHTIIITEGAPIVVTQK